MQWVLGHGKNCFTIYTFFMYFYKAFFSCKWDVSHCEILTRDLIESDYVLKQSDYWMEKNQ